MRPPIRAAFAFVCGLTIAAGVARADLSGAGNGPSYTAAGVVNAATQTAVALAPNTIATIYGTNLAWTTYAITQRDLSGGSLPQIVQGVEVVVNGLNAHLFYVSPTQINFLIPYELMPGPVNIFVLRDGVKGPDVTVQVNTASPGLFQWNGNYVIAEHADGSLVTASSPAAGGEIVVLFAVGLGHTLPNTESGRLAPSAAEIAMLPATQILLNGVPCAPQDILYAGLTPGFAGLYQINVRLPPSFPANPAIQVQVGGALSSNGVVLAAQ